MYRLLYYPSILISGLHIYTTCIKYDTTDFFTPSAYFVTCTHKFTIYVWSTWLMYRCIAICTNPSSTIT